MRSSVSSSGTPAASGGSPPFNPHSLYSGASSSNNATPSKAGASTPSASETTASGKKKQAKRRKVNLACIYCRRSHMTCDEGRPCQRCIKRDIGHLCHDESTKAPAPAAQPAKKADGNTSVAPRLSSSSEHSPDAIATQLADPPTEIPSSSSGGTGTGTGSLPATSAPSDALPFFGAAGLQLNPAVTNSNDAGSSNTAFLGNSAGPYSSVSPLSSLNPDNRISAFNQAAAFRDAASPLKAHGQGQGQQPVYGAAGSLPLSATGSSNGAATYDWGLGNNSGGLGGAGWLGLGGGPGGFEGGGQGFSGDSAGGNEFTLLSEFLESLDGSLFGASANNARTPGQTFQSQGNGGTGNASGQSTSRSGSRRNTVSGRAGNLAGESTGSNARASLPPPSSNLESADATSDAAKKAPAGSAATRAKRPRGSSVSAAVKPEDSSSNNAGPYPPSLGAASKTERFFLTAADQKDGSRDERLSRVIQAKYEAGLLRPYNHVNGYARLNRWMERNVSQASKRRILKPLSVFRPAFRAVAQSLTNIDLIFIEEAFERLLLDYDRVFSTQGIPACLWRRTGEIYKGNKEFAELVGVPIESLREGRLCIYELMAEESAVNYWEKYGAVSFDPGQKAVLTSCVLRTKNKSMIAGNKDKQSSAKIIAAQLPRAQGTAPTSGQTTPTLAPQAGSAAGLFPLTPLDGGTRAGTEAPSKPSGRDGEETTKKVDPADITMARSGSAIGTGGAATNGSGGGGAATSTTAATSGAGATTPSKESKINHIHCCFSFTIRRDQWNIPTMIVGNFLPTNPP